MENSEMKDMDGEAMIKEEYSGEDSAKNAAQNTALAISTLLDSHGKSILGNSTNIMYNQDNVEKLYNLTMQIMEKQKIIEQRLGISSGSESQESQEAVGSIQPTQGMQKPPMSAEEALQIMAENSSQNNSGGR